MALGYFCARCAVWATGNDGDPCWSCGATDLAYGRSIPVGVNPHTCVAEECTEEEMPETSLSDVLH